MSAKLLVIDDVVDMREMLHFMLTREGYSVLVAATGTEGLYLAKAENPDLIITDLGLPDLSGISLIKEFRRSEKLGSVPIIALTGFGQEAAWEAIQAGASKVAVKPADLDKLLADVEALLSDRQTR